MAQSRRFLFSSPVFLASQLLVLVLVLFLAVAPPTAASPTEDGRDSHARLPRASVQQQRRPRSHGHSNSGAAVASADGAVIDKAAEPRGSSSWPSVFHVSPVLDRLAAHAQASISQWFFGTAPDATSSSGHRHHDDAPGHPPATPLRTDSSRLHLSHRHMTETARRRLADRYAGSSVVRFNATAAVKRALVDAAAALLLDVWAVGEDFVDVRVHERSLEPLLRMLGPAGVARDGSGFRVVIADLPSAIYDSLPSSASGSGRGQPERRRARWGADQGHYAAAEADREWAGFASRKESVEDVFFRTYQPLSVSRGSSADMVQPTLTFDVPGYC